MKGGDTQTMKIEFYAKDVYGKTNLYIKDSKVASLIRTLTGKKTVDSYDLAVLIELGHEVIEVTGKTTVIPMGILNSLHVAKMV